MNKLNNKPKLGIDIGRVIIDGSSHSSGSDTAFFSGDEKTMLATPEMPDCFESIQYLTELFKGEVWLVSKCGENVQQKSKRWLKVHNFFEKTKIKPDNIRFCRRRHQKREICEELQINHFIDDHPEVHEALHGIVEFQYFFGPQKNEVPDYGIHVENWKSVVRNVEINYRVLNLETI